MSNIKVTVWDKLEAMGPDSVAVFDDEEAAAILAEVQRLKANQKAIQGHVEGIYGVVDELRERAERAEREREVMLKSMVEHDPTYPKAPWVVNKPWGCRLPYRWYLTEAEARAAAFRALGLAPAAAGDPETPDRPRPGAAEGEPPIDPAKPPLRLDLQRRRMTRCQADDDGYCDWEHCPQNQAGEPKATGRHCPLDVEEGEPHE